MDLALNTDGDLLLAGGDLQLASGTEEVAQRIRIRLRLFAGEWFLAPSEGVPYFQSILGRKVSGPALASIFRRHILRTPGVADVRDLAVSADGREVSIRFVARTTDGAEVPVSTEVAP